MSDRLEQNKATVMAFYDLMFNQCKPAEAIQRYACDAYIQHNPAVGDGKEAFVAYLRREPLPEITRACRTNCFSLIELPNGD